jgi:predicted regulator of Ras-like GTPase activity (Roadblock/LC7/MglB family)
MFREVLHETLTRTEGCLGVIVMGTDGIAVEQLWHGSGTDLNLDVAVAEFSSLIKNARRANGEMGFGKLHEVTLAGESGIFIFRFVSEDYFIAMVLKPEGNFGRGRYELKRAELLLEKELAC